jgi:hypothetical protein
LDPICQVISFSFTIYYPSTILTITNRSSSIKHLSKKLSEIDITKEDIGWDLASLELLKDDLVSQGDDGDTNFDDAFTVSNQ